MSVAGLDKGADTDIVRWGVPNPSNEHYCLEETGEEMFDEQNLPPGLEQDDWDDFVAHRKEIGKPMTDTAKRRMLMKLYRMMEAGEPISQCMERAMVNGWQDVYPMPPELRESRAQAHQDAKKQDVPEVDEETARENVRYLHDALNGTMKITGGGR